METEFWAAIAGAVIGGGITVFGQFVYERQRAWEAEKAAVTGLFFKAIRIQADFDNVKKHLDEGVERAGRQGMPLVSAVMPIVNRIVPIAITPEELSMVLRIADDDLTNLLVSLQQQHELLSSSLSTYNELRLEIDALGVGGVPDRSGLTSIEIDRTKRALFLNKVAVASNMLAEFHDQTIWDSHSAREALYRLHLSLKRRYRLPLDVTDRQV